MKLFTFSIPFNTLHDLVLDILLAKAADDSRAAIESRPTPRNALGVGWSVRSRMHTNLNVSMCVRFSDDNEVKEEEDKDEE